MYCTNCGTKCEEGQKFCQNCGAPVSSVPVQPASVQAAPVRKDNRALKANILRENFKKVYKNQGKYNPYNSLVGSDIFFDGEIPAQRCQIAINLFARGVNIKDVICFVDESLFSNGKAGFIFTVDGFYRKSPNYKHKTVTSLKYATRPQFKSIENPNYDVKELNKLLVMLYEADTQ